MKSLHISLVSGRSQINMERCLNSLKLALPNPNEWSCNLTITDNCSEWNVTTLAKGIFPDCKIIKNREMIGFGANHNNVLLNTESDYALIINDDIEIAPTALNELISLATTKEQGMIFGPLLFPGSWDSSYIAAGGALGERIPKPILNGISLLVRFCFGDKKIRSILQRRNATTEPFDEKRAYISGACCLVRGSYIREYALYDPEYYMYFDDIDFGMRMRQRGFECWQVAKALVMHLEGGSFSGKTWRWIVDSNIRYSKKFHSFPVTLAALVLTGILKVLLKIRGI